MLKHAINPPRLACIVVNRCAKNTTPSPPPSLQSSNNVTPKIEPSILSIHRSTNRRESNSLLDSIPPLSTLFPYETRAGSMQIIFLANNQQSERISNRRPIDSSPGDCRGFIIFPSIFSSLKGAPSLLPRPSIAPCRAKGEIFHGISRCRYIVSASNNALNLGE